MDQYHFPGLAACLVKDDQIIWKGNYGYADLEQNISVRDSTLFHIGSVSKAFTGTALLQLWEKGFFELEDDINDYLPFEVRNPSYPNEPITFRMLLTHTSSIDHDPSLFDESISIPGDDCSVSLDSFLVNYLLPGGTYYWMGPFENFSPGTSFGYTTPGFALIGYLVENITDTTYENYCQQNIFIPLRMNHTSWFIENLNTNHLAKQYIYSGGEYRTTPYMGRPDYPGVMLKSSSGQLARFLIAFLQKGNIEDIRILNSTTVDLMTTVQYPPMGLAWWIVEETIPNFGERTFCALSGGLRGVCSVMGYILGTEENLGAVVLTNRRDDDGIIEIFLELLSYGIITNIEKDITNFPKAIFLSQNYPNPFNPVTMIKYQLPMVSEVDLSIYNILGQKVATLVNERQKAGMYQFEWEASGFASGVYYYRIEARNFVETRKMIYLK
jgi:CubicO group peptidase (beta-lactamase class C family)